MYISNRKLCIFSNGWIYVRRFPHHRKWPVWQWYVKIAIHGSVNTYARFVNAQTGIPSLHDIVAVFALTFSRALTVVSTVSTYSSGSSSKYLPIIVGYHVTEGTVQSLIQKPIFSSFYWLSIQITIRAGLLLVRSTALSEFHDCFMGVFQRCDPGTLTAVKCAW